MAFGRKNNVVKMMMTRGDDDVRMAFCWKDCVAKLRSCEKFEATTTM